MVRLYVLPGLAADHRTFGRFAVPGMETVPLAWVPPTRGESLADYAHKLREQIEEDEPFCLMGISFGGMLMVELAKITQPEHTFVVGTAKTWREIPPRYRWVQALPHLLPYPLWKFLMVQSRKRDATVAPDFLEELLGMIRDSDGHLFRWSTAATMRWRNETVPPRLTHLHGTHDPLFPARAVQPHHWIEGGKHYLINTHADTLAHYIRATLEGQPLPSCRTA